MTILSTLQSASRLLIGRKPSAFFSSTDAFEAELVELANEAAIDIAKRHDWRALTKLAEITGNGVTTSFPLPDGYDRMPLKAALISSQFNWSLRMARDLDQWLDFQTRPVAGSPGYWIILDGQMQVLPAYPNEHKARFYYITNQIVSGGKSAFTADTDVFRLDERLLKLAVIWRWRALKRLEYAEDMQNFEIALSQEIARDKGARSLVVGSVRMPFDAEFAFPGVIVP